MLSFGSLITTLLTLIIVLIMLNNKKT
ncbi:putative holin-like toxin [Streptococcus plurextorum]